MSNSVDKTTYLQRLGDDWHSEDVYLPLIYKILPQSRYSEDIQDVLYSIYEQEHYNFKLYKNISNETMFSRDAEEAEQRIQTLQKEMEKEGKQFEFLAEKFEKYQQYLTYTSHEVDDEDEEDDYVANHQEKERGKGNMIKAKSKKMSPQEVAKILEEKKNTQIAQNTKSALATSQEKLLGIQEEIETLQKKKEYYNHYHNAEYGRQCTMKKLVLAYEKDQDIEVLIRGLNELLDHYNKMRRLYIPNVACQGNYKELCKTHFLPLCPPFYSEKGTILRQPQCPLTPLT